MGGTTPSQSKNNRNFDIQGCDYFLLCYRKGGSVMFSFLRRKSAENDEIFPPITMPLTNIQEVDEAGILYLDNKGNSANINYFDAYNGWCKSKSIKKSKPKYICDRTKAEGWKLIFYTNPQITFYSDPSEEELWIEILNKITLQGFPSFDRD